MKKTPGKVSLGDIARVAGVSRVTACYVMRNRPGPSQETRQRILAIAAELGYVPDARIGTWMAKMRDSKNKEMLPIAWLNTNGEKDSWEQHQFLLPYFRGAQAAARQLGYRIDMIWAGEPGVTMKRISQIVYQRGIEAAIITHPVRHLHLNWDSLACVSLEGALLAPRLHRVMTDYTFNLLLALKMVRRFGYRRIGICLDWRVGRNSYNTCRSAVYYFHATTPQAERVEPFFYTWEAPFNEAKASRSFAAWIQREKPDVIVGHNSLLVDWVEASGYRVPQDIGVVHIATDDDVSDWAGISSHREKIGAAAVERVVALLQNRQFGVPETALNTLVRGTWHGGRTLLVPKPKKTRRRVAGKLVSR